jgi:hypothetical protein
MTQNTLSLAQQMMDEFAYSTGLSSERRPMRYLWTDAFALCNFLELYRLTKDDKYGQLASRLIDQVHHVLGRHREDDPRKGWISELDEQEGQKHPTKGGLRIGKRLPERKPDEPFDELLEWERDGQYYHYLTKWMHALCKASRLTESPTYILWAIELAKTAHATFVYTLPNGRKSMYWKVSIDLKRPLVPFMGQHDPLDGFVTYSQLQAFASADPKWPNLKAEIDEISAMLDGIELTTTDPLGIGELLCNVYKVAELKSVGYWNQTDLLSILVGSALISLKAYLKENPMKYPADQRLAFREIGLAIGLHSIENLTKLMAEKPQLFHNEPLIRQWRSDLLQYTPLARKIEEFWFKSESRKSRSWIENRDINMVMLCTSLIPDGYLGI